MDTGLNRMINEKEQLKNQIENSIPSIVEQRNLIVHFSRGIGQRLEIELPEPIEVAEEEDIDDES